jgi:hypothetical protein
MYVAVAHKHMDRLHLWMQRLGFAVRNTQAYYTKPLILTDR